MREVTIESLTSEDTDFFKEMVTLAFWSPNDSIQVSDYDLERIFSEWQKNGSCGVKAIDVGSGEGLGAAWCCFNPENADGPGELGVAVLPKAQGVGIGMKLMEALLGELEQLCSQVLLKVHNENVRAVRLYQKCGFKHMCKYGAEHSVFRLRFSKNGFKK